MYGHLTRIDNPLSLNLPHTLHLRRQMLCRLLTNSVDVLIRRIRQLLARQLLPIAFTAFLHIVSRRLHVPIGVLFVR